MRMQRQPICTKLSISSQLTERNFDKHKQSSNIITSIILLDLSSTCANTINQIYAKYNPSTKVKVVSECTFYFFYYCQFIQSSLTWQ
jgi:hypothetical protein